MKPQMKRIEDKNMRKDKSARLLERLREGKELSMRQQLLLIVHLSIPAIFAQIFMILRYREQWIFWLIIDLATILLWYRSGNWCMVSQYVFWSINCIYGWILWSKEES